MRNNVGEGIPTKPISVTMGGRGAQAAQAAAKEIKDLHAAGHAQPLWDLGSGCLHPL